MTPPLARYVITEERGVVILLVEQLLVENQVRAIVSCEGRWRDKH